MPKQNTEGQEDGSEDEDFDEDEQDQSGEDSGSSDSEGDEKSDGEDDSRKKQSNFKNLYKKVKEQERLIKELTEGKKPSSNEKKDAPDFEARLYFVENPEAKEFKDEILEIRKEFGGKITLERAYKLAISERPKSKSNEDETFESRGTPQSKKKIEDVSPDEILKYSKEDQKKWRDANGLDPRKWEKKWPGKTF